MEKYREFSKKELQWIKELEKVMKKAPNTLFMFCGGSTGSMFIYPKHEETNERYMTGDGSVDSFAPSTSIVCGCEIEGGDW